MSTTLGAIGTLLCQERGQLTRQREGEERVEYLCTLWQFSLCAQVERIKEWLEKKKREDELVNLLTGEGPELPKPTPQSVPRPCYAAPAPPVRNAGFSTVSKLSLACLKERHGHGSSRSDLDIFSASQFAFPVSEDSLDPEYLRKLKRSAASRSSLVSEGHFADFRQRSCK